MPHLRAAIVVVVGALCVACPVDVADGDGGAGEGEGEGDVPFDESVFGETVVGGGGVVDDVAADCGPLFDGLRDDDSALLERLFGGGLAAVTLDLGPARRGSLRASPTHKVKALLRLTVDDEVVFDGIVGVALKGTESFDSVDGKPALRVDFNFADCRLFAGIDSLVFDNARNDPTALRQVLGSAAFRAAGLVAPRAGHATVRLDGSDRGLYVVVEPTDEAFVARNFASTRHVYEEDKNDPLVGYNHLETKVGDDDDREDLHSLQRTVLANIDDPVALFDATADRVDWPWLLRFAAVEQLLGHRDGYTFEARNTLLHFDDDGVVRPIGASLDEIFDATAAYTERTALLRGCFLDADCRADFGDALDAAAADLTGADLDDVVDRAATVTAVAGAFDDAALAARAGLLQVFAAQRARSTADVRCDRDAEDDGDGDGVPCAVDCDRASADVGRGAVDDCFDGLDQDCNGRADDDASCDDGVDISGGSHGYLLLFRARSHDDAAAACVAHGMTLATIDTPRERLSLLARAQGQNVARPWIGGDGCAVLDGRAPSDDDCAAVHGAVCEAGCGEGQDADGDGHLACGDDCADDVVDISPDAVDVGCNDLDCDGVRVEPCNSGDEGSGGIKVP